MAGGHTPFSCRLGLGRPSAYVKRSPFQNVPWGAEELCAGSTKPIPWCVLTCVGGSSERRVLSVGPVVRLSTGQPVLASVTLSLAQSLVHVASPPLLPQTVLSVYSTSPCEVLPSSLPCLQGPKHCSGPVCRARGPCPLPLRSSDARPGSDQVAQLALRPGLSWCPRIPHTPGDSPLSAQGCPQSCPPATCAFRTFSRPCPAC